ncbi:MAG: hypothetical protein AB8G95_29550 [Anaerolineae bacterium]
MKKSPETNSTSNENLYEAPAIVYETIISTRAGSPVIEGDAPQPPVQNDSIDLFPAD